MTGILNESDVKELKLLISDATIIPFGPGKRVLKDSAILIRNGMIQDLGPSEALRQKYLEEERVSAGGQLLLPGMILPHFHVYSAFARGMGITDPLPQNFLEILQKLWWRLDKSLTLEDIHVSARVSLLDCIRTGTTTVFDHHASPGAVTGSLERLAEVFEEFGVRGCLCYEVSDRDGPGIAAAGIQENMRFAERCRREASSLMASCFGLHASFTLSDATLRQCVEAARDFNLGFHLHLAEGATDREVTVRRYGYSSPVMRLQQLGVLQDRTIVAHAIDVTQEELAVLHDCNVAVVHNPQSNMHNGVGHADVEKMLARGLLVGLGSDGMTTDLFREIRAAVLLPKHEHRDPSAGGNAIRKIVTENHSRIASRYFSAPIGEIKTGAPADLIFLDYDPPTPLNEDNYWDHLVFGQYTVQSTMVNGKFLMRDREILVCEEKKVLADAREQVKKFWERF